MAKYRNSMMLRTNGLLEIYFWLFISSLVAGRPIFWGLIRNDYREDTFFLEFYTEILFAILVFIFPFLFKLIFGEFPFEYLRHRRSERMFDKALREQNSILYGEDYLREKPINTSNFGNVVDRENIALPDSTVNTEKEEILFEVFLDRSRQLSDKLYSRAGAYLLIGCLIAFAGVLFFYFQTTTLHNTLAPTIKELTTSMILLEYLPRIGTLAFVEAIAFFFLKQYRTTMEEYRYYEAIKRQRENQLTIVKIFNLHSNNPELFEKLIQSLGLNESIDKFTGKSIIESEKSNKSEIELIDKFVEILKLYKK